MRGVIVRQVLIESFRAREHAALEHLDTIVGGRSLCSLSRQGAPVPSANPTKERPPPWPRLAERLKRSRTAQSAVSQHGGALLDVHDRWRANSRTRGRRGRDWTAYLAGGLAALDQMIDDDGGLDELDSRN